MEPTLEVKARSRVALDVQTSPKFAELCNSVAQFAQIAPEVTVASDEDNANAARWLMHGKQIEKDLKVLKEGALAFPKLYTESLRECLRPIEDMLGKALRTVEKPIVLWSQAKREQFEAERVAAQAAQAAAPIVATEAGAVIVPAEIVQTSAAPPKTMAIEGGGKVTMRDDITVEITEPLELLKAIISTQDRNAAYTLDLIEFKIGKLKDIARKKRGVIPGCKVERTMKTAVTTPR